MKKLFLIIAVVALLFSCNNATKEKTDETVITLANDWTLDNLMGKVKSIEETEYTPDDDGKIGEMDSCCIETQIFNKDGFVDVYTKQDTEGVSKEETKLERTEDGSFLAAIKTKNGQADGGRTVTHDAEGKMLYAEDKDASGALTYFYTDIAENEFGQALSGKAFLGDSTFNGTWSRKYIDGFGAGSTWSDSTGTQLSDYTGELNEKGLLAKMTAVVNKGDTTMTSIHTFTYDSFDEAGNWTQQTKYDEEGKAVRVKKRSYTYFE